VGKADSGNSNTTATYVYDAMGQVAAEYSTAGNPQAGIAYLTDDHLGSTRLITSGTAPATMVQRLDYFPFGENINLPDSTGNSNAVFANRNLVASYNAGTVGPLQFTGKERDAETGLDYFGFRYFSSAQGRWTSPDRVFADQNTPDPQSWNMYTYVRNNPLRFVDRDGRQCVAGMDPKNGNPCFSATGHASWLGKALSKIGSFLKGTGEGAVMDPVIGITNTMSKMTQMSGMKAPAQIPLTQPTNTAERAGNLAGMIIPALVPGGELEETVTLFRAVSREEAASALAEGLFKAGENSLGGKFLAESAEDAGKWGDLLQGPGNYEIIRVELPKSAADSLMRWERLDSIGPARYGELNQLNVPGLNLTIVGAK